MPSSRHRQTTLAQRVTLVGTGAHTGRPCRMFLLPTDASSGIAFSRLDSEELIPASWRQVRDTRLRVEVGASGARVSTVEHVTAALSGLGVDNALIEVDGPEAPALDGSAHRIVEAVLEAGVSRLAAPRRALRILRRVRVEAGAAWAELAPIAAPRLEIDVEIDFPAPIGRQRVRRRLSPGVFVRELCWARSFGFLGDAERLWREGLALGATLDNSVVFAKGRVLNPGGLRRFDEPARHKALDALGDLALAGAPILGRFRSYRSGHALNVALVKKLMTTHGAFAMEEGASAARECRAEERVLSP
ncbi:UDP-3-O-acyl-N-acetylglucosamine deacetylase [Methylocystis bryophila]|uniref:UDP-3-O-acyl-N-acetylglucosamine deacetylase n=1 Tax=Methylocystis bryophila TaxID=655015 RepID=A0A1W6MW15_9HYPH|nr:UDP-3-O-acyl-N-acetylglucosamine deacetylase [Methylocystis bryophila]ARN81774.1 UDP-3-O-[3-hydroxymyristoyl] N-acetylglucosamine deacetylase [Methylocystis bryophila]BDV37833.1 UDP-3-O-acyl-N-acetylglucosamine deacetylase [Methylocystis bryophila]